MTGTLIYALEAKAILAAGQQVPMCLSSKGTPQYCYTEKEIERLQKEDDLQIWYAVDREDLP